MKRFELLRSIAVLLTAALLVGGCKDSHSASETHDHAEHAGHEHGEKEDHAGHDHDKPKPAKTATNAHDHAGHDDHDDHDHKKPAPAAGQDKHADHDDHVDEVTLTPQAIKRWNITLAKAQKATLTNHISVPARVSYNLEAIAHVGSLASGKVAALHARVGEQVKQGQPLCEIMSPELGQAQSDFLLKQSAINAVHASLRVAQTLHENARKLHEQSQGIALSEVQKREVDVLALQGSLQSAQGSRDAASNLLTLLGMNDADVVTLAKTGKINPSVIITSPITGRIIERFASLGESIGPDHDALFVVADMSTFWVLADVPEFFASQIQLGAAASIWPVSEEPASIQSKVRYIASELAQQTRTLAMRLEIPGDEPSLRPGMFVKVELTTHSNDKPVLAIADSGVQMVENQTSVFVPVQGEPNTFAKRVVKLGQATGRQRAVLEGLVEGESYVITGSFILKADLGKAGAAHEH